MNTPKLKLYTGIICLALLIPGFSEAYLTTNQSATRINSDTIIFTVSYKFGHGSRDLYMPIGAVRGITTESNSPYLGYTIKSGEDTTEAGQVAGLVLTNDKNVVIKDAEYFIPAGESAEFTLFTIFNIPITEQENLGDLSLLVSNLSFTMIDESNEIPARLNPSELQYYQTPAVDLK